MPASCPAVSARVSRGRSRRTTPSIRSSSAITGRIGWPRCSSSERYVMITRTEVCRRLRRRKTRRSRVDRSAQWASSITMTSGRRSARRSRRASICSNSRTRALSGSRSTGGSPNSGSSRARSRAPPRGISAAISAAPASRTSWRNAAVNGAYGKPAVLSSRQPPISTSTSSPTRAANSPISRVLPPPASAPRSTAPGVPPRARSQASARVESSDSRPTKAGLTSCARTPSSMTGISGHTVLVLQVGRRRGTRSGNQRRTSPRYHDAATSRRSLVRSVISCSAM